MKSRICATISLIALWSLFLLTIAGWLPRLASYTEDLRLNSSAADSIIQTLMSEHMRLPGVFSCMLLAVLWAPVIESKLPVKE